MLLKEVLSPVNGLFTNMPQTIWGADFDPSLIDIELFTRIGNLEISPLVDFYVDSGNLDTEELAKLLFQRYGSNWKRIWDALKAEYDIMLTSTMDEVRTITRDNSSTETRDLIDTKEGTIDNDETLSGSNVRTGSIANVGENETTRDLTDLETRALNGSENESGTEGLTDTYNESKGRDSTITYAGSERTETGTVETRDLDLDVTATINDDGAGTQKGTGSNTLDSGRYGIGDTGLAKESREANEETRNFTDTKTNLRSEDSQTLDTGTVETDVSEVKTFTGRNDKTDESETHTGTVKHDTTFGKMTTTTDVGTLTNKATGTEGVSESRTETYNSLTDAQENSNNSVITHDLIDKHGGSIDNVVTEEMEETFHSEGSSPLRTFQALIQEEIEGRSGQAWNFTDLVIRDVQAMIVSKIWRRRHGAL